MKIQKIYIFYTITMWIFWGLIMISLGISGNAFDVQNEQLFLIVKSISKFVNCISLIPVIPTLWIFALVYSIKIEIRKYVVFNVVSILFSVGLWFQYFITHIVLILGGA